MSQAFASLISILDLEPVEHNLFLGRSPQIGWQRVFGGQVLAQALMAAHKTINNGRIVHSLHSYFLRPGDPSIPILYEVACLRDGGSFSTRSVLAKQNNEVILTLSASFHSYEIGLEHSMPMMPDIPPPENVMSSSELGVHYADQMPQHISAYLTREQPIEMRPITPLHYVSSDPLPPVQHVWMKLLGEVPNNHALQAAVLAYISDVTLLDGSLFPHGRTIFDRSLQAASLDHAMWFHRPHALDEWLLYSQDTPNAFGGRGFSRGAFYTQSGILIASTAQEGLIRLRYNKAHTGNVPHIVPVI
jgi:acyl-CoA thioesterase II